MTNSLGCPQHFRNKSSGYFQDNSKKKNSKYQGKAQKLCYCIQQQVDVKMFPKKLK